MAVRLCSIFLNLVLGTDNSTRNHKSTYSRKCEREHGEERLHFPANGTIKHRGFRLGGIYKTPEGFFVLETRKRFGLGSGGGRTVEVPGRCEAENSQCYRSRFQARLGCPHAAALDTGSGTLRRLCSPLSRDAWFQSLRSRSNTEPLPNLQLTNILCSQKIKASPSAALPEKRPVRTKKSNRSQGRKGRFSFAF